VRGKGKSPRGEREKEVESWAGPREGWAASLLSFLLSFSFLYSTHSNKTL
jgi:hypothetical protein